LLQSSILDVPLTLNFNDYLVLELDLNNGKKALLAGLYRSSTPDTAQKYDNDLINLISELGYMKYSHSLILGDFNLNKLRWDPDPILPESVDEYSIEFRFVECTRDAFLTQLVDEPTCFRGESKNTLHLVFSNDGSDVTELTIGPGLGKTDHTNISLEWNVSTSMVESTKKVYKYDKTDLDGLYNCLNLNWTNMLEGLSAESANDRVQSVIEKSIERHVPSHIIRKRNLDRSIGLNAEAVEAVKRKRQAWNKYKKGTLINHTTSMS
jgi:hypothetical protein